MLFLNYLLASIITMAVWTPISFFVSRDWIFGNNRGWGLFGRYLIVQIGFPVLSQILLWAEVSQFGLDEYVAFLGAQLFVACGNFLATKFWVFGRHSPQG